MKKEFSKHWKSSKQPRKKRKYIANAPIHIKRKLLGANLSKDLRKKQNKRSIVLRTGDKVKIMRGKFKGKEGKVTEINVKRLKVYIEGIQTTKQDGSKVNVPMQASNLQITELDLSDKKRTGKKENKTEKSNKKTEDKPVEKKKTKKKTKSKDKENKESKK